MAHPTVPWWTTSNGYIPALSVLSLFFILLQVYLLYSQSPAILSLAFKTFCVCLWIHVEDTSGLSPDQGKTLQLSLPIPMGGQSWCADPVPWQSPEIQLFYQVQPFLWYSNSWRIFPSLQYAWSCCSFSLVSTDLPDLLGLLQALLLSTPDLTARLRCYSSNWFLEYSASSWSALRGM